MQIQGKELESPPTDTKSRLLDAAARLFASQGYIGASVRKLVAEGDVDHGSVRYHFGGKHGLFQAVLENRFGALCASRDAALDAVLSQESHTLTDLLTAYLRPTIAFLTDPLEGRTNGQLLARSALEQEHFRPIVAPFYGDQFERFLAAFGALVDGPTREELTFRFLCLHGLTTAAFSHSRPAAAEARLMPDHLEQRLIRMAEMILRMGPESAPAF